MLIEHAEFVTSCRDGKEESAGIRLRCPRCYGPIGYLADEDTTDTTQVCPGCRWELPCEGGIWKTLLPERAAHFSRFMQDYQFIRASEGRGSIADDYYLSLPYRDLSGRNRFQWAIRARTFRYIERKILPRIIRLTHDKLRVLDLGAGNGWMSYRLALRGHLPVAVDLLTNDEDGLGAAFHYERHLPALFHRLQAEFDRLPFADGQFDLIIFNASFHYSQDYLRTLAEALRCAVPGGVIIIADTAWYRSHESGQQMLRERKASFQAKYGTASDAIYSLEYLTDTRLQLLEKSFGLQWQLHTPYYGIKWTLRPLLAHLRKKREPARFRIYLARKPQ